MELVTTMLKLSRNMKVRKTAKSVQFSSQPQFEQSQPQPAAGPSVQPRSILRRGTVILETVLYSPPIKTLEQHLVTVREGRQEDRFIQLMEGEGESSIKKQTSQKLKRRLSEIGHARLNLSKKLDGPAKSPTPSVNHQMSRHYFIWSDKVDSYFLANLDTVSQDNVLQKTVLGLQNQVETLPVDALPPPGEPGE